MNYSLNHIVREPKKKTENPPLLLMLHGYGSNEQDLFSFANELPDELLIVSARAPITMGFGGYAWYSIHFDNDDGNFSDIPEANQAKKLIIRFINELQKTYHFSPEKSFMMGFSQGAILSYALALSHYPNKINNIIALSGYINQEMIETQEISSYKNLDFFCSHGIQDDVIPISLARETSRFLTENSISHKYKEYQAGHGVNPQNFYDFKNWIHDKLQ